MRIATMYSAHRRWIYAPVLVLAIFPILGRTQDSATPTIGPQAAYFRDCTPADSGAQECSNLEKFWPNKLAELGESTLPDQPDTDNVSIYRFSAFALVSAVPFATVRIIVRRDGSIDTFAARRWNDGRIEKAQEHVDPQHAEAILSFLNWAQFYSMSSRPLPARDLPPAKDKQPRIVYTDGGSYLLEGVHSGSYHVIWRRTFRDLAPEDQSWETLSGLQHALHDLNVWTSQAKPASK